MSLSMSCVQYFAVVLLLTSYSIKQVSSLGCYTCDSDVDRECIQNPAQRKFGVICSSYRTNTNSSILSSFNPDDDTNRASAITYNCASAIGISTKDGSIRVVRGCAVQPISCRTYQMIYAAKFDFQLNKCLRCNTDFCNYIN